MAQLFIYRNLHKDCYSIRYRGIVIAHAKALNVSGATFKVNESGRNKVIQEKKKNVHAFVTADHILAAVGLNLTGNGDASPLVLTSAHASEPAYPENAGRVATYNPYKAPSFTDKATGEPVHTSVRVTLASNYAIYY